MKTICSFAFLLIFAFAGQTIMAASPNGDKLPKNKAKPVKKIMEKVANRQINRVMYSQSGQHPEKQEKTALKFMEWALSYPQLRNVQIPGKIFPGNS